MHIPDIFIIQISALAYRDVVCLGKSVAMNSRASPDCTLDGYTRCCLSRQPMKPDKMSTL